MPSNVASQTSGDQAMGQMHFSPSFPAPSEPSSLLTGMLWPRDRDKAVDTPPWSRASRPRAALGGRSLGANCRLEGRNQL